MKYKAQIKKAYCFGVLLMAATTYGATLSPITPTVDHSKKATCGIKWTIKNSQPIKYFEVYRGTTDEFWDADIIAELNNTTDRLTDWGADQYQNYYYWVIPYDYNDESNVLDMDLSRYVCQNHRYWGNSDVYLTSTVKTLAIGTDLPLYFKVNLGTSGDPLYDHVKPDNVRITRMTDLNGNDATDIAYICGNRGTNYAKNEGVIEYNTYLKANGSFGYIKPNKPGVLYIRAYYKNATTVNPLRIEIKKPTFNLYAPEGEIDIVDNNYRDLYLKCNGKFVCPDDLDVLMGESVAIIPYVDVSVTGELSGDLYENSFGFLAMQQKSDEPTRFDISFNGIQVKELEITPVWDSSRQLSLVFMDSSFRETNKIVFNKEYNFGIKYGTKMIPHKVTKGGRIWLTYWGLNEEGSDGESYNVVPFEWDLRMWYTSDGTDIGYSYYSLSYVSSIGELGVFTCPDTGWVNYAIQLYDRVVNGSFQVKSN